MTENTKRSVNLSLLGPRPQTGGQLPVPAGPGPGSRDSLHPAMFDHSRAPRGPDHTDPRPRTITAPAPAPHHTAPRPRTAPPPRPRTTPPPVPVPHRPRPTTPPPVPVPHHPPSPYHTAPPSPYHTDPHPSSPTFTTYTACNARCLSRDRTKYKSINIIKTYAQYTKKSVHYW